MAVTWSFFTSFFYYNLFLELEKPFWIHPRDQNKKLGIYGLPFGNKNDSYKKGRNLVISYHIFYYNLFLELEQPFWIHLHDQNKWLGFYGYIFSNGCN